MASHEKKTNQKKQHQQQNTLTRPEGNLLMVASLGLGKGGGVRISDHCAAANTQRAALIRIFFFTALQKLHERQFYTGVKLGERERQRGGGRERERGGRTAPASALKSRSSVLSSSRRNCFQRVFSTRFHKQSAS